MLKQLSALILFSALSYPQSSDSLTIQSFKTNLDTIISSKSDSAAIVDTSKTTEATKKDTLVPIQGEPLTDVSNIINKRTFLFDNYRYTGDLLRSFSFNFIKDLGFIGYPNESFIYGVGDNGISYLQDGVLINNRFTNSLDLNLVQSEDIDSIEIVPSPRGFLYGPYNNPVTVNFITRDFISTEPYSRVKYYEGPDGEAMIDGKFNARIFKRWNLGFQVTNRKFDSTYTNSEFSIWQVNTKLKYFLSNSVNITSSYYFVHSKQGMNGGVDYDSLGKISDNPNLDLYNSFIAPVVSPNQKLDVLQNNFSLRALAKPFNDSQLDLSIYYRYGLDKLRDFRDSVDYKDESKSKSYGTVLNYYYSYDFLTLQIFGDYEKSDFGYSSTNYTSNSTDELYNLGGLITLSTLDNMLKFSIYYKDGYRERTDFSYNGMGTDLKYILTDEFSFYAGYSIRHVYEIYDQVPTIEAGFNYKNFNLVLDLKYFNNEYINELRWSGGPEYYHDYSQKNEGLGIILNYKLWILLLETNSTFYFNIKNESRLILPKWQFVGGIYVNELFFGNNLNLKAGFKFHYTGEIKSSEYWWLSNSNVDPTNKLDFTLAGEIKKVAIFYFIWENLFGNQYYITPYYPMPERNIRFGLAWELFN
jgi:outer membrane cobalamin receptor